VSLCSLIYSNEQKHVAIPQTSLRVCPLTATGNYGSNKITIILVYNILAVKLKTSSSHGDILIFLFFKIDLLL
jgi:hypothetical protein